MNTNIIDIIGYYYINKDHIQKNDETIKELNTFNSNLNIFLQLRDKIISSNQKLLKGKYNLNIKRQLITKLINYSFQKINITFQELKKIQNFCEQEKNIYNKLINDVGNEYLIYMAKNIYKNNVIQLIKDLSNINDLIDKNKNKFQNIHQINGINQLNSPILEITSKITQIKNIYQILNKKLNIYYEIQLTFKKKNKNDFFNDVNILKTYKAINIQKEDSKYKKIIGYYEIGISEDEINKKIYPILFEGVKATLIFILISIIASLFLALYIIYPIHILDKGADEISKDLKYRIKLKRKDEFGKFAHTFNHLSDQITEELEKYQSLYKEATEDGLTKLMVRKFFMQALKVETENAQKEKRPTSLIMTDIDHFKKFNDTYGHQTGDLVLAQVAEIILKNIRKNRVRNDLVGRYGGEEFVVLLSDTNLNKACELAERIRKIIETTNFKSVNGENLKVTISMGVSMSENSDINPEKLIEIADKGLYKAKETGRNKVSYV